jgi:diguanylate cyclase (GGDEF)-like protein
MALLPARLMLPPRQAIQPTGEVSREDVAAATAALERPLSWMRFPATLEQSFLSDGAPRRLGYFLLSGLLSLFIYNGFLLVDYLMVPDVFWLAIKVRLAWFTPFATISLAVIWWRSTWLLQRGLHLTESLVLISGVLAAASLAYILSSSHAPNSQYYHVGLMIVIIYGNLVQRLRFWYAVAFSVIVYIVHITGVLMVQSFNPRLIPPMVAMIGATLVFTLMANYALERDERRQYLLSLRRKYLLKDLGDVQNRLHQLSRVDSLTGLFNRRHFQEYLQQTWQRAQHDHAHVAIVMLDVDHFKQFNDRYGHPAGDQCLVQVAQAMQDSLRQPDDLVARYGGEEFIAVLPGADADTARKAAERIREAVTQLDLAHDASTTAATVTVSVGVSSCRACEHAREQDLIAAADSALYKAKRQGRNQVASLSL